MNLHEQLTACGFTPLTPGTYRHASGQAVTVQEQTLTLAGEASTLHAPEDLSTFCWERGLFPNAGQLAPTLAPWPAKPRPQVAYRDGDNIRVHTREGDAVVSSQGIHDEAGRPWADDTHDPRHLYPCLITPGGIIGVYQVEGGQSGEMLGTLTLTRGTQYARVDFQDDDTCDGTWLSSPQHPDLTADSRDAAAVTRLFTALAQPL